MHRRLCARPASSLRPRSSEPWQRGPSGAAARASKASAFHLAVSSQPISTCRFIRRDPRDHQSERCRQELADQRHQRRLAIAAMSCSTVSVAQVPTQRLRIGVARTFRTLLCSGPQRPHNVAGLAYKVRPICRPGARHRPLARQRDTLSRADQILRSTSAAFAIVLSAPAHQGCRSGSACRALVAEPRLLCSTNRWPA